MPRALKLNTFQAFALEQLQRAGPTTARNMFGGIGCYADGIFFAIMDSEALYLKVDDSNRADFEARGMEPFRPFGTDAPPMHYWMVPEDVLEEPETLRGWVDKAIAVGRTARTKKKSAPSPKRRRPPSR